MGSFAQPKNPRILEADEVSLVRGGPDVRHGCSRGPDEGSRSAKDDGEHADELYGDGELDLPEPRKASGAVRGGGMWC